MYGTFAWRIRRIGQEKQGYAEEQRILNEEMYRTDTVFETLADTGITLTVDTNKTDSQNMPQATSFAIEAKLHRYYSDRADLTVFRVIHKSEEAGE